MFPRPNSSSAFKAFELIEWDPPILSSLISVPWSHLIVNINHICKIPSKLVFDPTSGRHRLVKVTRKINHLMYGCWSDYEGNCVVYGEEWLWKKNTKIFESGGHLSASHTWFKRKEDFLLCLHLSCKFDIASKFKNKTNEIVYVWVCSTTNIIYTLRNI